MVLQNIRYNANEEGEEPQQHENELIGIQQARFDMSKAIDNEASEDIPPSVVRIPN